MKDRILAVAKPEADPSVLSDVTQGVDYVPRGCFPALTDPHTGKRCECRCHRNPNVMHMAACCFGTSHVAAK